MTLLESLAALVILGTSVVGFLEVFHTSARAAQGATEWAETVGYAETVMEATKVNAQEVSDGQQSGPRGYVANVETRPWARGVREVIVVVTSPTGQRVEVRRLEREAQSRGPGR